MQDHAVTFDLYLFVTPHYHVKMHSYRLSLDSELMLVIGLILCLERLLKDRL